MVIRRGEIWWAELPAPRGSEPGFRHPVVIVQANAFNDSRIATAIVAVITSNLARAAAPGNVRLGRSESGLPKPSVINVSQLFTLDRTRLSERVKLLPQGVVQQIDEGLRQVLSL